MIATVHVSVVLGMVLGALLTVLAFDLFSRPE